MWLKNEKKKKIVQNVFTMIIGIRPNKAWKSISKGLFYERMLLTSWDIGSSLIIKDLYSNGQKPVKICWILLNLNNQFDYVNFRDSLNWVKK